MSINLVQWEGSTVTPKLDAIMYDDGSYGIIKGCAITHQGTNLLKIASGFIKIAGRLIEITEETIACEVSSSGTVNGQLWVRLDLGSITPVTFMTEAASVITPLTQNEDCNFQNGIYELQLATYNVNESVITNLVETAEKLHQLREGVIDCETYTSGQGRIADAIDSYVAQANMKDKSNRKVILVNTTVRWIVDITRDGDNYTGTAIKTSTSDDYRYSFSKIGSASTTISPFKTTHTDTYTYPSGSTGGTYDMGVDHKYRYVNASNVYTKGKADGKNACCYNLGTVTTSINVKNKFPNDYTRFTNSNFIIQPTKIGVNLEVAGSYSAYNNGNSQNITTSYNPSTGIFSISNTSITQSYTGSSSTAKATAAASYFKVYLIDGSITNV